MKKITILSLAVMGVSIFAFAPASASASDEAWRPRQEEVKHCWFQSKKEGQHDKVKCRVTLKEFDDERGVGVKDERVDLDVECSNHFRLRDENAVQEDKGDDEFNLGTWDGKIALLKIKDEARQPSEKQEATLIISSWKKTLRLEGKCAEKEEVE